ncbi:MAG: ABC transporter permease [Leptospiraceae bacterium]|nr:ABC transporter permease [Leptospiraceae bacterium]MCB1304175.1 ABC transporter permease [Leptospiraceae bacterium]
MFQVVRVLIVKELLQTFRDRRMLFVIFVAPVVQIFIFGVAVTNEVRNVSLSVADLSHSSYSRRLVSSLTRGGYFRLEHENSGGDEVQKDLLLNRAVIGLVIPPDFASQIEGNRQATVQILVDGSDGNSANIATGYALRILSSLDFYVRPTFFSTSRIPAEGLVDFHPRVFYNPAVESRFYLMPGIITMVLTVLILLLTAMGITKEKESGSFEHLVVSPISGMQLMLGKTLPFALVGFFDACIVITLAVFGFGVPLTGSLPALILINVLYIFAMLGLGLLVSSISASQQQAMLSAFAIIFPAVILSDFFFPVSNMPVFIQWITYLNPMKYSLQAQRIIFLKGAGLGAVANQIAVLAGFAVAFYGLGTLQFRRSLH